MTLDDIKNNKNYITGDNIYYSDELLLPDNNSMCGTIDVSKYIGCTVVIVRDLIGFSNLSDRRIIFYNDENYITSQVYERLMTWYPDKSNTLLYTELTIKDKNLFISLRKTGVFSIFIKDFKNTLVSNNYEKSIYVSPSSGNDANSGESSQYPVKTINRALELNAKTIELFSGTYMESIDLSKAKNPIVNINNYMSTGRVIIMDPEAIISTTEELVDGYSNVYKFSCNKKISEDNKWIYQENVNDNKTLISDDEVHPLQRGYFYRCPDTKIYLTSISTLEEALNDIETSSTYKWFYDKNNNTIYFSRPLEVTENNPICISFGNALFRNSLRKYTINMTGIEIKYFVANFNVQKNSTITDCKATNVFGMGAFTYNSSLNIKFIRCEAANCVNGSVGDGFNGHGDTGGYDFNKNTTATFIDCYSHDNNDDGYSDHEKSETTIIGGLFEYNGKAGITPAGGSHCTCYNVYSRKNYNGFKYTNQTSEVEGGNGGQLICYNCYAINNTRSNSSNNGNGFTTVNYGNKMICINCISDDNKVGYNAGAGTHMTLINCTSINDISPKENSDNMTIKNGTIVS